ncbi:hypothetical protein IW140_003995 [Coemansia sp. RSA 1813]|nr:hypothetical protein EV178_003931 [Coemansia sp. RSA 1646]KAJ1771107.1 hypothetical protein LPJ74_002600 [Coemansia sp. RSA 1843]KAJ2217096.1 hypothetical protein EV179_000863 [Coemansia sp. RSA 487]KAJ2568267.1 hypothetical protein IW140_003995 [Coemansia sp. RSA 1813]
MSAKKVTAETRPQSQFFSAPKSAARRLQLGSGRPMPGRSTDDAGGVGIRDVLRSKLVERIKAREEARARGDDEWDSAQFVQLDRETSDHVKSLIQQSDAIRRVRKERIFEDEVTEEEQSIIQQRVALQQRQFAEFERREFAHKSRRIRNMYGYLDDEEMREALVEARNDVEEAIYQFSTPGYLMKLRKAIALRHMPLAEAPQMTDVQRVKYEEMLRKRNRVQKKTTTSDARDKYRTVGRLPLDEALAQLQRAATAKSGGGGIDLSRAMKGWSEARIKAFKAIKTKPNTYYYRFNAPGEEQRTGQWTQEEQKLFHARLGEIGANGQWGIFSMVIPGRVGYQCSNYYRYLVENRLINDPNYVLDENGKAHYLFTTKKKNPDGSAMRVFRKHKKPHVRMSREKYGYSDSDSDDAVESAGASGGPPSESAAATIEAAAAAVASAEPADNNAAAKHSQDTGTQSTRKTARVAGTAVAGRRKRKRRGRNDANSSDEDVIRANEVELSDDGARTSDGEYQGLATSKRARGRGARSNNLSVDSGNSSTAEPPTRGTDTGAASSGEESALESDTCCTTTVDPENPLPELIDPITLEPVAKPAISPYGHVMDYNSWVRCLMFPPEGSQRNVCPLTKKPLSKRDLVVLTYDNIEQYRGKIVNL